MNIKRLEITNFRHLSNLKFDLGEHITVIAGGNGTGKTSLLGIIGHIFKYGNEYQNLFGERFETKYSSVFKFSAVHDYDKNYTYRVVFDDDSVKNATLRTLNENSQVRHRIDVGGRVRGGGKVKKPLIFLSLKRLIPIAQENERNIKIGNNELTENQRIEYNTLYNTIFSVNVEITPVHTKSNNKNTFSPTSEIFDSYGISAGQDNIGSIILAILSFSYLKEVDSTYDGGLLFIDEIDATLYPAAQKNLLRVLLQKARELSLQVIFTTHSSDILNFLASKSGAAFKHSTNFVSLSNSLGQVTINQGFNELRSLLADLNHEALRTIKPKKINFYFEDAEAYYFYKNIINDVNLGCEKVYKNLSISCGTYKSLIEKGFEEFFRSVVVLDGDFKSGFGNTTNHNVVFLPGIVRPENIVKDFLESLPESDLFWDNEFHYSKRVFLQSIDGVQDNRESMKRWFTSQIEFWGTDASNLFSRWKALNVDEANAIISKTTEIVRRIMNNFYELSTYNQ